MYATLGKLLATQLGPAAKILGSKSKEIIILIMLLVILYQNISGTRFFLWADTIPYLRSEIDIANYELDLALEANGRLEDAIETNNAQIDAWEELSTNLGNQAIKLKKQLASNRTQTNTEVREIISAQTPQSCEAAFDYLRDSINELEFNDVLNEQIIQ